MANSASISNVQHWWESPEIQTTLTNSVSFAKSQEWSSGFSISEVLNDTLYKRCKLWHMQTKDIELKMKTEVSRGDSYLMHVLQSYINSCDETLRLFQIDTSKKTLAPADTFRLECYGIASFLAKLKDIFPHEEHNLLKNLNLIIHGEIRIGTGELSDLYKSKIYFKFDLGKIEPIGNDYRLISRTCELKTPVPIQVIKNVSPDEKIFVSLEVMLEWSSNQELINLPAPIQMKREPIIAQLLGHEKSKDFTIVAENGAEVKCHKAILSLSSPVFEAMLSPFNGMKEFQNGKMTMTGRSEQAVVHFIRFLYEQEIPHVELKCDLALELLQLGHMYELEQLWKPIYDLLLEKPRNWFSTDDVIIELYYFIRNLGHCETLEIQLLRMMKGMTAEEIRSCERVKKLESTEVADLMAMMYDLREYNK